MDTTNTDDPGDEIGSEQLPKPQSIFSLDLCSIVTLYNEEKLLINVTDPIIIATVESEETNLGIRIIKRDQVRIIEEEINRLLANSIPFAMAIKTDPKEISGVTFTEVFYSGYNLTSLTMGNINDLKCLRDELLKRRTLCTLPCIDVPESYLPNEILILGSKYISLQEYYDSGKTLSTDDFIQMLYQTLDFVKTLDRLNLCLQKTGLSDFCRNKKGNFFFVPLHLLKRVGNPVENFKNYWEFIVNAFESQKWSKAGWMIINIKKKLMENLNV
ncbi:hypothetical protein MHBO_003778 [Bonamia ostreae]|uniref:Uncharacterized protein n=1 Tax=Bonamia ostreae TaxID=126728 RepID=A0ABV2ARH2_9EUKA